jgi:hypothetical protein
MRADPSYLSPHIQLGVAYSRKGDHAACLAHRQETAARFPNDYLNHYNLGVSQRREAQRVTRFGGTNTAHAAWECAVASFERAKEMEPKDADVYVSIRIRTRAHARSHAGMRSSGSARSHAGMRSSGSA